jgi:ankyrin repeat protein
MNPIRRIFLAAVICSASLMAPLAVAGSAQALLEAVMNGQAQRVAILLDAGASPEVASGPGEHEGKTALMWAAEFGRSDIADLLLQYGAKVDRGNPKGGTALMFAAVSGHVEVVDLLVAAGADPRHRVRHGWTPLLLATAKGHVEAVRALARHGADLDTRDVYGWTLLMRAVERGDRAMVSALLGLGLDPASGDGKGLDAFDIARRHTDPGMLDLLKLR